MMILDIGCGKNPLMYKNVIHADKDKKSYHLEVICDIYNLPFRKSIFDIVHLSHILEHLEYPQLAIKKIIKICKKGCIIKVPNAKMLKIEESKEHLYSWIDGTLRNFLLQYFICVKVYGNIHRVHRTKKLQTLKLLILALISRPYEIIAICHKGDN